MKGKFEMDDDRLLLDRYEEGDERAFTELVDRHKDKLYRVAYRMVGSSDDALDLVQLTFVRLCTHRGTLRWEARLSTWLYRVLVNLCKNYFRDTQRRGWVLGDDKIPETGEKNTQLDALVSESSRKALQSAIGKLPEKQRATVVLRIYEDLSFEEIAGVLGCSIGTAKSNFHYSLKNLSRNLRKK